VSVVAPQSIRHRKPRTHPYKPRKGGPPGSPVSFLHDELQQWYPLRVLPPEEEIPRKFSAPPAITLNACNAGLSLSSEQLPIAQLIADQLRRNVFAYQVGMYFSQNPNDTHRGGIGQAPSSLPMYMLPQGGVPKPKPTQFRPQ
jgi:hypothetical protein